ncbi:MAG: hypothetical protein KME31_00275 [Tolypothrix carrinoi HA7290-LM1]|nr:hypothetical protein [Tolypothrix carrinoi HA7290-LM1]
MIGKREKGKGERIITNDGRCFNALNPRNPQPNLCPMPNAPCPMPHAQFPMPNYPLSITPF